MGRLLESPVTAAAARRPRSIAAGWLLLLACACADAADWQLDLDLRLLDSDGRRSFLDGGLGALRYGEDKSGLRLGRARFALNQAFGDDWTLHLDAFAWGDEDKNPADLTEAYVEFRPPPRAGYRLRVKAGAFYAPISLENRAAGWETPYTLTPSALNSWVGEELRTIGIGTQFEWLGTRLGHDFDLGLSAAIYAWNDPAGGLVASHGFALSDRQTTLFGRVGPRGAPPLYGRQMFHEIDGRPGFYLSGEARYLDRLTLQALHYDNRADPTAFAPKLHDFAWKTRFDSLGLRAEAPGGWSAIFQWLAGETYIAPPGMLLEWTFSARFLLLSKRIDVHQTLSARYDDFRMDSDPPDAWQRGDAWTAAYSYEFNPKWRATLEWLQVSSRFSERVAYLGEPAFARENLWQLALRYSLHGAQ